MLSANKPLSVLTFRQLTALLCLVGTVVVLLAFYIAQVRADETLRNRMEQINITNRNSAKVVEENVRLILTGADTVLQLMQMDMETHGRIDEEHKKLLLQLREQYELNAIIVRDADGNSLFSAGSPVLSAQEAIQQDFFQAQKQHDRQGLYIGTVMVRRAAETPSIILTRRINDKEGNFKGIVSARLEEDNLVGIYNELELGTEKGILLLRRDRTFLSRFPRADDLEIKPGYFIDHPVFKQIEDQKIAGQYETKSVITGQDYISAYRAMQDYPVVVIAGMVTEDALAPVRALQRSYLMESAAFAFLAIVAFFIIWRQMRKQMSLAFIIKKDRSLLSATMLSIREGIIVTNQYGKIVLLNTMAQVLTGYTEAIACDHDFSDIVKLLANDKRINVTELIQNVLSSGESRYLLGDTVLVNLHETNYCIEGSVSPVVDATGDVIGIVFSFRDVTEARQKQQKNEYLSRHDQLTGLFNRNFLEEIMDGEMARASRYERPLCMIIFDLDHFKRVNDRHGHPIGDKVLKQTAKISQGSVRKADIVARLGGEEFIIVMPQTDIAGGLEAAEKLRALLEQYAHLSAGVVTASFGVAEWRRGESFQDWYKRADTALYSAKQGGRNRVVNAETQPVLPVVSAVLVWQREWESGNEQIDEQHKNLMEEGNRLIQLSLSGASQEQILAQVNQVLAVVGKHFSYEEQVIQQAQYPEGQRHAVIHKRLVEKAMRLKAEYEQGRIKAGAFFSFIVEDIVVGHMLVEDVKFFPYLRG